MSMDEKLIGMEINEGNENVEVSDNIDEKAIIEEYENLLGY